MAESQVPFQYSAARLTAFRAAISDPRFDTYLQRAGHDQTYAFALYLYNARLAKAFLFPLHMAEVVLRNAIDEVLCNLFGLSWHVDPAFRGVLSQGGIETLDKAIDRVHREKGSGQPRGQFVATLTFDFWSNLFRPEYDRPLWQTHLHTMLPLLSRKKTRPDVQKLVREINHFRNRIAHHEPILGLSYTELHRSIIELIHMRCAETAAWTKHHSTVNLAIRSSPAKTGHLGPTLGEVCDRKAATATGTETLARVLSRESGASTSLVRLDSTGCPDAAVPAETILRYVTKQATAIGGIIDLNDHTVDDVINDSGTIWAFGQTTDPASGLAQTFRGATRVVIVTGGTRLVGLITKAHRRY